MSQRQKFFSQHGSDTRNLVRRLLAHVPHLPSEGSGCVPSEFRAHSLRVVLLRLSRIVLTGQNISDKRSPLDTLPLAKKVPSDLNHDILTPEGIRVRWRRGAHVMECGRGIRDRLLVQQCLAGSRTAWDELYDRFLLLVRKIIRTHLRCGESDTQDMIQNVFLSVCTALKNYDHQYPLSKFVWVISERVCIDELRKRQSAKRLGDTVPANHHDHGDDATTVVPSRADTPERQFAEAELHQLLRLAFRQLGDKCRELLRLRYLQELSFKEIIPLLGGKEKTLAVQTARCLAELKNLYHQVETEGQRP